MAGDADAAVRSLPVSDWPEPDRVAWEDACRPGVRLKRGGAAAHLRPVSQADLAQRYGYYLDHLKRTGKSLSSGAAADQVNPPNIGAFLAELRGRVSSVTLYGTIYKVRRFAELVAPHHDLAWLREIENELDFLKRPTPKLHKLALAEELAEAALTLLAEAEVPQEVSPFRSITAKSREARWRAAGKADRYQLNRGVLTRNGLMLGILAFCPIRLKNLAALTLGSSMQKVGSTWFVVIGPRDAKTGRADERPLPDLLTAGMNRYVEHFRPILARGGCERDTGPLWLSSEDGKRMSYGGVESCVRRILSATIGVEAGAHMARTAAATTAASRAPHLPGLGSAVLQHSHPRVTEEHYNRATAHQAAKAYSEVLRALESR